MTRSLPPTAFAGDDGSADPALAAALARYANGDIPLAEVVEALAGARVLVPIVATHEQDSAEMALVTLRGRDGRVGVPAFTSVATLSAWNRQARPVPVDARRLALATVAEGADVVVLDIAGPVTCAVPRPAVWALARGRTWTPSPADPDVAAAVEAAALRDPAVAGVRCEPGDRAELRVVLAVRPGLDRSALDDLTSGLGRRLAASEVVAERVASVEMRVTAEREPG